MRSGLGSQRLLIIRRWAHGHIALLRILAGAVLFIAVLVVFFFGIPRPPSPSPSPSLARVFSDSEPMAVLMQDPPGQAAHKERAAHAGVANQVPKTRRPMLPSQSDVPGLPSQSDAAITKLLTNHG